MAQRTTIGPRYKAHYSEGRHRCLRVESLEDRLLLSADFSWSMAPRVVADQDGRITVPNTADWVNPPRGYEVLLDLSGFTLSNGHNPAAQDFVVDVYNQDLGAYGGILWSIESFQDEVLSISLHEGYHDVRVTASDGSLSESAVESVDVNDILIVALGDSYASGEGNPEVLPTVDTNEDGDVDADDVAAALRWMQSDDDPVLASEQDVFHRLAHRSSDAASAQLALRLENEDPKTSVTFVFLAESGATIDSGALGPYDGLNDSGQEGNPQFIDDQGQSQTFEGFPPQTVQLLDLADGRDVDVLTASFGGNDIGFGSIINSFVFADSDADNAKILEAARSGLAADWEVVEDEVIGFFPSFFVDVTEVDIAGLDGTPGDPTRNGVSGELDRLANALNGLSALGVGIAPESVFITEYPSPSTTVENGEIETCDGALLDAPPLSFVDTTELELIDVAIISPLNQQIQSAAIQHGWHFVDGIVEAFEGHGYCGDDPDMPASPESARWIVQYDESYDNQGNDTGTVHPNALGHTAIADILYDAIDHPVTSIARPILGAAGTLPEGGSVRLSASMGGGAPTTLNKRFRWDLDADGIFGEIGESALRGDERGELVTLYALPTDDGPGRTVPVAVRAFLEEGVSTEIVGAEIAVVNSGPVVSIQGPAWVAPGVSQIYQGSASDPSNHDTVAATQWTSTIGGTNVAGSQPMFHVTPMSTDPFELTLRATDSDGKNGAVTRVINFDYASAISIPFDQLVGLQLSGDQEVDILMFEGVAGREVSISAYWGGYHPENFAATARFRLLGPGGTLLASPSNQGETLNGQPHYSRLNEFVLPEDGTYYIEVRGNGGGSYTMAVSDPAQELKPLPLSGSVSDEFVIVGDLQEWTFDAFAGQTLFWAYEGQEIQGWEIYNSSGAQVDSGTGGEEVDLFFQAPATDSYLLVFREVKPLQFQNSSSAFGPFGFTFSTPEPIPFDQPVGLQLSGDQEVDILMFEGVAGREVSISAYWGGYHPENFAATARFRLLGPGGTLLASPSNQGETLNGQPHYSRLNEFVLPEDGTYYIEVRGNGGGSYTMAVSDPAQELKPLPLSGSVSDEFVIVGDLQEWTFDAFAGQTLFWAYEGQEIQGWEIYNSSGAQVDSGTGGEEVDLFFQAPATDSYLLVFREVKPLQFQNSSSAFGPFGFTFSTPEPIPFDQPVGLQLSGDQEVDILMFEGVAGREVSISAYWGGYHPENFAATARFRLLGPGGTLLASPSNQGETLNGQPHYSRLNEFVLPEDGTYYIEVRGNGGGSYTMAVSDPAQELKPLPLSGSVSDEFVIVGDLQEWTFDAFAGQTLFWAYEGQEIQGWEIYNSSGAQVDSGTGGEEVDLFFQAPATDSYLLVFREVKPLQFQNSSSAFGPFGFTMLAIDSDSDGVSDNVESGVPYDGNGNFDDEPDRVQGYVTSLPLRGDVRHVTISAPQGHTISSAKPASVTLGQLPADFSFVEGIASFTVEEVTHGAAIEVALFLHSQNIPSSVRAWADQTAAGSTDFSFDGTTGATIDQNRVTLYLVDGGRGDADQTADGRITVVVAPAYAPVVGDYDRSGAVDEQDYDLWRSSFGAVVSPGTGADGNTDGVIDAADYSVWRDNLGAAIDTLQVLPGDYNRDGEVDEADYYVWRSSYGASTGPALLADGNRDGRVGAADYSIWRDNLGAELPSTALETIGIAASGAAADEESTELQLDEGLPVAGNLPATLPIWSTFYYGSLGPRGAGRSASLGSPASPSQPNTDLALLAIYRQTATVDSEEEDAEQFERSQPRGANEAAFAAYGNDSMKDSLHFLRTSWRRDWATESAALRASSRGR